MGSTFLTVLFGLGIFGEGKRQRIENDGDGMWNNAATRRFLEEELQCAPYGRVVCTSGKIELEVCTDPDCIFCEPSESTNGTSLGCDESIVVDMALQCDGNGVEATNCTDGSINRVGRKGWCFENVLQNCDTECDCSCYENGFACGNADWDVSRCDRSKCLPGTDFFIGPYCYDGANGCDDWGCDLVGDEAGPCCQPNDAYVPHKECEADVVDPGPTCSCDCYENAYACGLGEDADDARCDPQVCDPDDSEPYCYDGGNQCDNRGCDFEGDEAGPCCSEDSEAVPQLECETDVCDCDCYENGYACGVGISDDRCDETCEGLDQFGSAYCFSTCGDFGCDLVHRAGGCCQPGDPITPQDCGGSKSSKSSSSSSSVVIIVVVVCVVVVFVLAIMGVYLGKFFVKKKMDKYPTVEGVPADDAAPRTVEVDESKANDNHEEAIALKLATVELTATSANGESIPTATATSI